MPDSEKTKGQLLAELESLRAPAGSPRVRTPSETALIGSLNEMIVSAPVGFILCDSALRYLFVNENLAATTGIPAAEHIGRTVGEVLPELGPQLEPALKQALENGESVLDIAVAGESRAFPGETRHWLADCHPVHLGGNVLGVGAFIRDATEIRRAEERKERYRSLIDSLDEGFCIIEVLFDSAGKSIDYRFMEISPVFEKQTGIKNAVGRRMREIAPQHEEHWFKIFGDIALTGNPVRFENPAQALGRYYDVYAFRVGSPEQRHVAILFNDITARKQAEDALRLNEERYRAVVEDQTEVISRIKADGTFVFVNDIYCRFFGKGKEQLLGHSWKPRAVAEDVPMIEERLRTLAPDNPVVTIENRVYNASGEVRWMQFVNRGFFDENGVIKEIQAVGRDITDPKRMETELQQAKDEMADDLEVMSKLH